MKEKDTVGPEITGLNQVGGFDGERLRDVCLDYTDEIFPSDSKVSCSERSSSWAVSNRSKRHRVGTLNPNLGSQTLDIDTTGNTFLWTIGTTSSSGIEWTRGTSEVRVSPL